MRTFPVVVILANGDEISDSRHQLVNDHHVNISRCQSLLNSKLLGNETATIYVIEESNKVFCETPDGTTFEFF